VFLDRDGVINRMRVEYVRSWDDFELLPGALDAIGRLTRSGRDVIIVTNQSAIAQRFILPKAVDEIHVRLAAEVVRHGGRIRAFLICPHGKDDGCGCRKPAPGLFFRARDELGVDLADAVMVGDQVSDVEAAHAAGCDAILLYHENPAQIAADSRVAPDLATAADMICGD
jgi:D-glycero-D-manno-heptose 1,7-bisphosphate phosphatase